jgi:hypothetical protein
LWCGNNPARPVYPSHLKWIVIFPIDQGWLV